MVDELLYWLKCYLGAGVAFVVLLIFSVLLLTIFFEENGAGLDSNVFAPLRESFSTKEKRYEFFMHMVASLATIAIWPAAIVILVIEIRESKSLIPVRNKGPKFSCELKDLLEIVQPQAVEADAIVSDPLARTPDLPFGHLNNGWLALKSQMKSGDSLWRFRTSGYMPQNKNMEHQYEWPRKVLQGYAIVRRKKIIAEFLTQWN